MLLFVDNLTNVDFSWLDAKRGLLGETWLANVRMRGALDEQGMVCDFGQVKKVMRRWLDEELDHRLAVPARSPQIRIRDEGEMLDIHFTFGEAGEFIHTRAPRSAIALVDAEVLTAESVADWCIVQLKREFPTSIDQLELDFSCEEIPGAFYHYSHGLQQHRGNCQRIAHGHRSRIDIWLDGDKAPALEANWAERWCDIYLGTQAHVRARPQHQGQSYYDFAYRAPQGDFALTLPQRCCYLIDTESTVELLAQHLANSISQEHPGRHVRVKAYEGIHKGAIAEAGPAAR